MVRRHFTQIQVAYIKRTHNKEVLEITPSLQTHFNHSKAKLTLKTITKLELAECESPFNARF